MAKPEWPERAAAVLGPSLALLRRQRGLTQDQLAESSGLCREHISCIERGEHQPGLGWLLRYLAGTGFGLVQLASAMDCLAHLHQKPEPLTVAQVGRAVAELRLRARLDCQVVAERASVAVGTVWNLEQGFQAISAVNLLRVLASIGVSLEDLELWVRHRHGQAL